MSHDPLKLQTALIDLLGSAADHTLTASEAKGELEDLNLKLDLNQVRSGFEQLVSLGRAYKPKTAPGAPVAYQLVAAGAAAPPPATDDDQDGASDRRDRILAAIPSGQRVGAKQIQSSTGLDGATVRRELQKLCAEGLLERTGKARGTAYGHASAAVPVSRETSPPPPGERTRPARADRKAAHEGLPQAASGEEAGRRQAAQRQARRQPARRIQRARRASGATRRHPHRAAAAQARRADPARAAGPGPARRAAR